MPIDSYCSIERLALIYFSYAQQDHKLNVTGITDRLVKVFIDNCGSVNMATHLELNEECFVRHYVLRSAIESQQFNT
jgi:hypothetical protein